MKTSSGKPSRQAFTLIELLAVIAIVGVLAGIIIAMVGRSRSAALDARCLSTQRQIGIAIQLYASEHKNRFPGPCYAGVRKGYSNKSSDGSFFGYIAPYQGLEVSTSWLQADALTCPAWSQQVTDADQAPVYLLNDSVTTTDGTTANPWGYPSKSSPIPVIQLANPSTTWLLKDIDKRNAAANATWYSYLPPAPVHGGGKTRIVLFADFSARTVSAN